MSRPIKSMLGAFVVLVTISSFGCSATHKVVLKADAAKLWTAEKQCVSAAEIIAAVEGGVPGWLEAIFKNAECVTRVLTNYQPTTPEAAFRANIALGLVKP